MSQSNEERIEEMDLHEGTAQRQAQQLSDDIDTHIVKEMGGHEERAELAAADSKAFQRAVDEQKPPIQPAFPRGPVPMQQAQPEPILRFFKYEHLPRELQYVSAPFTYVALSVIMKLPRSAERTVALRKLLESKDAAVRAAVPE